MPVNDLIVLSFIISMFAVFMATLGAVAWWSAQPAKKPPQTMARSTYRARRPDYAGGLSAQH